VQRVKGTDAHHLYEERPAQPMHTLKIGILDPSGRAEGYTVDTIKRTLRERVPHLAPLRWRVVPTPGRVSHPVWIDVGLPDFDQHVRQATVPAPGGRVELAEVVSAIASTPLDRTRPLWELWLLDGLDDGTVAVVFKLHHALADGLSSAQLIIDLMDGEVPDAQAQPEQVPSSARLLAVGVRDVVGLAARFPGLAARSWRASAAAGARRKSGATMPAKAFTAPMLAWNTGVTPHRWYAFTDVALADLKAIKDASGCTLNDVVLAVSAGAVRSYLADGHGVPAETLTAAVPISIRRQDETRTWGNRLSNVFPSLATDIEDPVARLHAIHDSMAAAKEYHDARDPELWQDWWDFYPILHAFQRSATRMMHRTAKRPTYSMIVSNVRGPSQPLSSNGAPLRAIYSMGPLVDDLGLNITAWSYLERMSFGVVTCKELIPDVWDLAERIPVAVDELLAAVSSTVAPPTSEPA